MIKLWRVILLGILAGLFVLASIIAIVFLQQKIISIDNSFIIERWWAASRLEVEHLKLHNALLAYETSPNAQTQHDAIIRFEILWSRVELIEKGVNSKTTAIVLPNQKLLDSAIQLHQFLIENEDYFYRLNLADVPALHQALWTFSSELYSATQSQLRLVDEVDDQERKEIQTFFKRMIFVLIAMSLIAVAYSAILFLEIKRNKKLAKVAETANQTKSTFLAKVSHEMRTPLNGIIGTLQIFDDHKIAPELRTYLDDMHHSSQMLLANINDLLDLTKLEYGKEKLNLGPLELTQLLPKILSPLERLADTKDIEIELTIDPLLPDSVLLDAHRISQVITNLLSNAIKFTEKGKIEVWLIYQKEFESLLFKCIDSGIGINNLDVDKIFSPFQQADKYTTRRFGGTGLGLTISKQLIEKMSGSIGAYSLKSKTNPDAQGSCFWFEIPIESTPDDVQLEDSSLIDQGKLMLLSGYKVLVAEDNRVNQKIIKAFLKRVGAEITLANDGEIALTIFKENQDFDVILMDCQMPNLDGYQTSAAIREFNQNIPIIAVTAHSFAEEKARCLAAGMNGFISKPIKKELLYERILAVL